MADTSLGWYRTRLIGAVLSFYYLNFRTLSLVRGKGQGAGSKRIEITVKKR